MTMDPERSELSARFVDWIAGDVDGDAPEIDLSAADESLPAAFSARLAREKPPVVLMLTRLSHRDDLMESVMSKCWEGIATALSAMPLEPGAPIEDPPDWRYYSSSESFRAGVYLVLRLTGPAAKSSYLSVGGHRFWASASRHDPTMLRYLLTWAAARPDNREGWHFGEDPPPETIWRFEAQHFKQILSSEVTGDWSVFDWSTDEALNSARRMAGAVDIPRLQAEGKRFFSSLLACLVEVDKVSRTVARAAATLSTIPTFCAWIAPIMKERAKPSPNPKMGRLPMPGWVAGALRVLPLEKLDQELDRLDSEEERLADERLADERLSDRLDHHDGEFIRHQRQHLQSQLLAVGWATGAVLDDTDGQRTVDGVRHVLQQWERTPSNRLCGVVLLWADLLRLVEYRRSHNYVESSGVIARLSAHLVEHPDAWAISAREILHQADGLGNEALDLLSLATVHDAGVRQTLATVAQRDTDRALRDRAQGLIARVDGGRAPDDELRRWLADSAARAFDGIPLFPHPLTPLSRTWLGSTEIEDTLNRCLRQAASRFGEKVRAQGGALEEVLTGMLVADLEHAFVDLTLRLKSGGRPRLARTITVSYRSVTKVQEKVWGCDIAFVLDASLRPSVSLRLALLVQVKKPEPRRSKRSELAADRWRIDLPQLATILEMSESASYLLICSTGELACVTARWLHGLAAGRDALTQGTVTVGYNEVRHTAVSLDQFLAELFLGTWLGSAKESTLAFASGEGTDMTPRHIFEIEVHQGG